MIIENTTINGCFIITPKVYNDHRGCFFESFNATRFETLTALKSMFVQDNISVSNKGVLRGLHYQETPYSQAKLVTVLQGKGLDVCVDIRKNSPSFGKHIALELSAENKKQVYIPKGFAHGFLALEHNTMLSYKCDAFYNKDAEKGIIFNDKTLNIDWGLAHSKLELSDKDLALPEFTRIHII